MNKYYKEIEEYFFHYDKQKLYDSAFYIQLMRHIISKRI